MTLGIWGAIDQLNHPLSWRCFCSLYVLIVEAQAKHCFFSERFLLDR